MPALFFQEECRDKGWRQACFKVFAGNSSIRICQGVSEMVGLTGMLFHLFEIVICMVLYFVGLIILKDELVKNLNWRTLDEERNKA